MPARAQSATIEGTITDSDDSTVSAQRGQTVPPGGLGVTMGEGVDVDLEFVDRLSCDRFSSAEQSASLTNAVTNQQTLSACGLRCRCLM